MMRQTVPQPWEPDWRMVWERDDPYTIADGGRVFVHRGSGVLLWSMPDATGDEGWQAASHSDEWLEIPPLSHAEHHRIFQEWRNSAPPAPVEYFGSIGGFFDENERADMTAASELRLKWSAYLDQRLQMIAAAWLARHGLRGSWEDATLW